MGKVININKIENEIVRLKANGGMWRINNGKYAIKHLELEKLANKYSVAAVRDSYYFFRWNNYYSCTRRKKF